MFRIVFFFVLSCFLSSISAAPQVVIPRIADDIDLRSVEGLARSSAYRVEVRPIGGMEFSRAFVFETTNSWTLRDYPGADPTRILRGAHEFGEDKGEIRSASFTRFSFADTAIEVRVTLLAPDAVARSVDIRPLRHALTATIAADGRSFIFVLPRPLKVSVEVNDRLNPLFFFTDAPDTPDLEATYYFGPGLHRLPGDGQLTLASGERVYLAAGAIVEGRFVLAPGSRDIVIRGRGILSNGEWPHESWDVPYLIKHATFYSEGTHHFHLEGLTLVNATGWTVAIEDLAGDQTHDNRYENLSMVHWAGNSDGIWITGDRNRVDDCFLFINDDGIVTKGGNGSLVTNVVFWGGIWGHLTLWFNFGRDITDLTYERIDVIGKEGGRSLIWGRKIRRAPNINLRNITFRDVRVEDRRHPEGLQLSRNNPNRLILVEGGDRVSGLRFENFQLSTRVADEGSIGQIVDGNGDGVVFQDFRMGGRLILSAEESHITFEPSVDNVRFLPPASE